MFRKSGMQALHESSTQNILLAQSDDSPFPLAKLLVALAIPFLRLTVPVGTIRFNRYAGLRQRKVGHPSTDTIFLQKPDVGYNPVALNCRCTVGLEIA